MRLGVTVHIDGPIPSKEDFGIAYCGTIERQERKSGLKWVDPDPEKERSYRVALSNVENYERAVMKAVIAGQFVPDGDSYIPEWCPGSESEFEFSTYSAKSIFDWVRSHGGKNESN